MWVAFLPPLALPRAGGAATPVRNEPFGGCAIRWLAGGRGGAPATRGARLAARACAHAGAGAGEGADADGEAGAAGEHHVAAARQGEAIPLPGMVAPSSASGVADYGGDAIDLHTGVDAASAAAEGDGAAGIAGSEDKGEGEGEGEGAFAGEEGSTASSRSTVDYELGPGEVGVRFTNTPEGRDVVAAAQLGDPLLGVGDSVGVRIPRSCQSGLCGSCTVDVLDAHAPGGRQTIRACQAGVALPDAGPELVVDVARMRVVHTRNPLARFDNLDTDYVAGAPPRPSPGPAGRAARRTARPQPCPHCDGSGVVVCYNCDGSGLEVGAPADGVTYSCYTCVGMKELRCATCQGSGEITVRR